MSAAHSGDTRARYLDALLANHGTLRLPIRSDEHDLPLQAIFQPLALRHGPFSFENQGEGAEAITARNGTEALARSAARRMIVLGGPGMGKTTLLKALLHMAPDNVEGYKYGWAPDGPAIQALSHLYLWITPEILQTTSRQQRIEDEKLALKVLALSGKDVPVDLIKNILDDSSRDCYLRMEARQTLHAAGVHLPLRYFLAEMGIGHEYSDYVTVESVHELGPQAPIEELLRLLVLNYDGISGVNYNGLEIASLLQEWGLRDQWIYETVVEALRESAPYVPLEPLIAALEHRNRLVRERAVRVLGAFGERAPIDKLIAFMEKYGVQQALLETFAELRSYIPIQVMETAISRFKQQKEYVPFWLLESWGRDLPLEPLLALSRRQHSRPRLFCAASQPAVSSSRVCRAASLIASGHRAGNSGGAGDDRGSTRLALLGGAHESSPGTRRRSA